MRVISQEPRSLPLGRRFGTCAAFADVHRYGINRELSMGRIEIKHLGDDANLDLVFALELHAGAELADSSFDKLEDVEPHPAWDD